MQQKNITDYEIMAPVGSYESLAAAIRAGADSVYFGVEGLNMRSRSAQTFTLADLKQIAETCAKHHIQSYLTVNTILYDNDMNLMQEIINAAKEANISAIIASDVAALMYARSIGVEVHLSTQLNISNIESLKFYAQFADVVVLARELNMEQVSEIHRQIVEQNIRGPKGDLIRIEMFCHGALCMAVSGKCYLSLHEMNASANRGECNQICRHGYRVKDLDSNIDLAVENEYIMSPKDLKTIHFLNKMMDAGVHVFKIEGRARGAEYVKTVVECYKEAIQSCCDNTFSSEKIEDWNSRLEKVFNRGFWDGYYLGQRLGEWTHQYGNQATEKKLYVGKVIKYFSKLGVAEFLLETQTLSSGDKVLVTGPTTGALIFDAEEIRLELMPTDKVEKGDRFSLKTPDKVRPSDKLYKLVSTDKIPPAPPTPPE
jgi:putative protease